MKRTLTIDITIIWIFLLKNNVNRKTIMKIRIMIETNVMRKIGINLTIFKIKIVFNAKIIKIIMFKWMNIHEKEKRKIILTTKTIKRAPSKKESNLWIHILDIEIYKLFLIIKIKYMRKCKKI